MISGRLSGRDSLLFVYGTLRSFVDIPMARWLRRVGRYVGAARTRGRLYDLGPYPGLRAARGDRQWVVGEVYRVTSPRVWRVLDRYEAGPAPSRARFVRVRCEVWLARGGRRSAFVYLYQRQVSRTARIASGDYLLHCRRRR